eukprot:12541942-Alexandrium_andersonii.AAC.1
MRSVPFAPFEETRVALASAEGRIERLQLARLEQVIPKTGAKQSSLSSFLGEPKKPAGPPLAAGAEGEQRADA